MERVGVRKLRQNLSLYLRRVKAGETLDVTERGRSVARLVPAGPPDTPDWLERLVAEGDAVPATSGIADLPSPEPSRSGEPTTAEILDELREDRV